MSLLTKVGSFAKNNTTGTQAITGVGFTPKAIIFWTSQTNGWVSGTWTPGYSALFGMTAGPTNSYCVQTTEDDAIATSASARTMKAKAIAATNNIATGQRFEADLQSFDADGFTLNWTANAGGGSDTIFYMALGGTDITGAKAVTWTTPATAVNKSVTGVGFKPDLVLHAGTGQTLGNSNTFMRFQFGMMNKHGQQAVNAIAGSSGTNPSNTSRWQQTNACFGQIDEGEVLRQRAHFVSMDADGFTTFFSNAMAADVISLCLQGVSSKIGAFDKPTDAATVATLIPKCGFTPKAVLATTNGTVTQSGPTANATWALGATDGTNHRTGLITSGDAVSPTQADGVGFTDSAIATHGGLATTGSKATGVAFTGDGFVYNFSTNDATASEILYLALGDAGVNTYPSTENPSATVADGTLGQGQRKIDRNQDGTLWAWDGVSRFKYSKDDGATWTADAVFSTAITQVAFFIDVDDYAHLVYKYTVDGKLYYNRGTPNAGRTAYAWNSSNLMANSSDYAYPDVVAFREGTGWAVHCVWSYLSGTQNLVEHRLVWWSAAGAFSFGTYSQIGPVSGNYGVTIHCFPSLDFNHTGDGKTVAGGTPHLYAAWSSGTTGAGKGIRFRKATYAAGAWTWNTEREIDSGRTIDHTDQSLQCMFTGVEVVIAAPEIRDAASGNLSHGLYRRDAADTTTTTHIVTVGGADPERLITGSATYDADGNVYLFGCNTTPATQYIKWVKSAQVFEPRVLLDKERMRPYITARRGNYNGKLEWLYTAGNNSPWSVKYDRLIPANTPATITTTGNATFTAYSTQRKLDRCQNGVLWMMGGADGAQNITPYFSVDNGKSWTWAGYINLGGANILASNFSMFIDLDDYCHIVWKQAGATGGRTDGAIYYLRGTPNAGRTAYTWGAAQAHYTSDTFMNYPDIVAHREGTGWKVHIVCSYLNATPIGQIDYGSYTITSGGVISLDARGGQSAVYSAPTGHQYPSIDFNHTGDGKTVAGGTPHLYVAWSAGSTGAGKGIRFKKATYAAGAWTWGAEREIDNTVYINDVSRWLNCLWDGSRVLIGGFLHNNTGPAVQLRFWERDAADTTTTPRITYSSAGGGLDRLYYGSMTYDSSGNVYFFGTDSVSIQYRKWVRATTTLGPYVYLSPTTNTASSYVSVRRGSAGQTVDWVYTYNPLGSSSVAVKYDRYALPYTTQALAPDGVAASTNVTGAYTDVDDSPDAPDANAMAGTGSWSVRYTFPSPTGQLVSGAGLQKFRIKLT